MEHLTRNDFYEYIDGALDPERRCRAASHIEACERCGHELRLIDALERAAGIPPTAVPPEFTDAVMARILVAQPERPTPLPARRRRFVLPVAVGLGYLAILVVVGIGAPEGRGDEGGWIEEGLGFLARHAALFTSVISRKLSGGEGGILMVALMTIVSIAALDSLLGKKSPRGRN